MKQVYNYDSVKYGMLKAAIDRGSEISNVNNPMYANGQLTELAVLRRRPSRVLITPTLLSFRLYRMRMRITRTMR